MILASFNQDGDLKSLGEFLAKVFLGVGLITCVILGAIIWLILLTRASKRRTKLEADEAMKTVDEIYYQDKLHK